MRRDILLNSNNDLLIVNGDLVIGDSLNPQQELLLVADKGSFKQNPDIGVGIFRFLESENTQGLLREVRTQFSNDGIVVNKIGYDETGKLKINPND